METIVLNSVDLLRDILEDHPHVLLIISDKASRGRTALTTAIEHDLLLRDALVGVTIVSADIRMYSLRQTPIMVLFHYGVEVERLTGFTVSAPLIEALYRAFESIPEADASGLEDTGDD